MAEIIIFTPKAELDASSNMRAFIELCRSQLTVFGADLDFDDIAWDVTAAVQQKGQGNKRVRIYFSTLETTEKINPVQMAELFVSFAKSYVRYMQGIRFTKNPGFRVTALRALEAALGEASDNDPVKIDGSTFNRAANLITSRLSRTTSYRIGAQLEIIAQFMSEHQLTAVPLSWRSPIKRPIDTVRVGPEFDKRRAEKMPSQAALEALPKAFHIAVQPKDVLYSSIAAILCSAPDRINEVLLLVEDCEVHDKTLAGINAYGLRWWPAKGAEPSVKWVIPSMTAVVKEAISRIRKITEVTRQIAKWYESNPTKLYLPPELEYLRGQPLLEINDVNRILFVEPISLGNEYQWCRQKNVPLLSDGVSLKARFEDLERVIISMLPNGFPMLNSEIDLKYSDALIITRRNELHPDKATYQCIIDPVSINQVNTAFGARSEHGFESMFDRLGFAEADGSPIRVTTHQFRHYLTTLAQAGGMSQLDIAKWSGRVDIRQNEAYNHVSAGQMLAKIRQSIGNESEMFGPLAKLPKNIPISRDEFARLKIPTAHTTDFGFCVHDYTMMPCELHADCINCNEHVCVKGDELKASMIKRRLEEAQDLLERAKAATKERYYGADRWMEHHQRTVTRLKQLASILDDPAVPIGSVIQLSDIPIVTRIQHAVEDRARLDGLPLDVTPNSDQYPLLDSENHG